jgi:hypothetical protein
MLTVSSGRAASSSAASSAANFLTGREVAETVLKEVHKAMTESAGLQARLIQSYKAQTWLQESQKLQARQQIGVAATSPKGVIETLGNYVKSGGNSALLLLHVCVRKKNRKKKTKKTNQKPKLS